MNEIDKKIERIEKDLKTPFGSYDGEGCKVESFSPCKREDALWLIDQLKECRKEKKLKLEWVAKDRNLLKQRTKEACKRSLKYMIDNHGFEQPVELQELYEIACDYIDEAREE